MTAKKNLPRPAPVHPGGLTTLVLSGLAGAMLLAGSAFAADSITSLVKVSPAEKDFSGTEWRAISLAGNRVLWHVNGALHALADRKNDEAGKNIAQGLVLVQILEGVLPVTTVQTTISGAGTTYSENNRVAATFGPLYRAYDSVDGLSPGAEQKQAKASGEKAAARNPRAPAIPSEGMADSSAKLDLRMARRDLAAAQDLIKSADTPAATEALKDLLTNGVTYKESSGRRALTGAMDNLRLAESEMQAGHPGPAKAALRAAEEALQNYEVTAVGYRSPTAKELSQQTTATAKNLPGQTAETLPTKIASWWGKLRTWL